MDKALALYDTLNSNGVRFYHWAMNGEPAATIEIDGQYAVFMDFAEIHTSAEELVLVAHEGGHVCTGTTHKLYSPYDLIARHECKANKWAIANLIPEEDFDQAIAEGYTDIYALADHFGVTEDFMRMTACWYIHGNLAADLYL